MEISSHSSNILTRSLNLILEKLQCTNNKTSTKKTYLSVWRQFNNFVIKLDVKPNLLEKRTALFLAYLVDNGAQSAMLKSYVSAIKRILTDNRYIWNDNIVLLSSLTRACVSQFIGGC